MTWAKFGTEYFDRLAEVDFPEALEDACPERGGGSQLHVQLYYSR